VGDSAAVVPQSGDSRVGEQAGLVDPLVETLDRADRATKPVLVRWLLNAEVPFMAASVMLILDPEDAPFTAGDVAEMIGISVDDATRALHELRSLGFAQEERRRYEPTEKGRQAHESLAGARRDALAAFVSSMSEAERRELADALNRR
jgi:DNA-binding MarR family transcriptional regulator